MKRLLFFLTTFCISQTIFGFERAYQDNEQSPFLGEWSGIYSELLLDEESEELKWKDEKLVVRIEQYGQKIIVRIKCTEPTGELKYYWDPYNVVSASSSEIIIKKISEETYYAKDRTWIHAETTFKILYEQGRLHFIPVERMVYERYPSGGKRSVNTFSVIKNKHLYLYKNDNW